jgi:hypothetical protein
LERWKGAVSGSGGGQERCAQVVWRVWERGSGKGVKKGEVWLESSKRGCFGGFGNLLPISTYPYYSAVLGTVLAELLEGVLAAVFGVVFLAL